MRKFKFFFLLIFILAIAVLMYVAINHYRVLEISSQNKNLLSSANSTKAEYEGNGIVNLNQECLALNKMVEKLNTFINDPKASKRTPDNTYWVDGLKILTQDSNFAEVEKIALINNTCGAEASGFLSLIYTETQLAPKAEEVYQRLQMYAATQNFSAIQLLCTGNFNPLMTAEQKMHYCELVFNDNKVYKENIRNIAFKELQDIYFQLKQSEKLVDLCEKGKDEITKKECFLSGVNRLSLYYQIEEKNHPKEFFLLKKLAVYDDAGLAQSRIAHMYLRGEGIERSLDSAIYWHKQAIQKLNVGSDLWLANLHDMGAAYYELMNYPEAFQCYRVAAIGGLAHSRMNLANLYARGHGALQDYKQAYAWISIAVAQGLEDSNTQAEAEKLKRIITMQLALQDPSGAALKEAQDLTKEYYSTYILHEKPSKQNKLAKRLRAAIKALTD